MRFECRCGALHSSFYDLDRKIKALLEVVHYEISHYQGVANDDNDLGDLTRILYLDLMPLDFLFLGIII